MIEHGCSKLSVDESGWCLDRLAGLQSVVTPELIRQALSKTERFNERFCKLTHEVMLWVVVAMGLFTNMPIRQVFKACRRMRAGERTPGRSSLCEARQRLGVEPVRQLHTDIVRPLATPDTPGAFYKGCRLMAIDGTVLDALDNEANTAAFERASNANGEGAFPQVRKVSLVELGTHVEVAIAIGGYQDGEQTLARQLWDRIPSDALLMEDRGFFCYGDWKELDSRGIKLLVRLKSNLIIKPIQQLSDGSCLAKIYPTPYYRERDRHGILVRLIEYTLDDPQRTGHGEKHRLLTNLLDVESYPALELIPGYHERWEQESTFDEQKTHQDPIRAEKPANLRSGTPDGVRQELYALSLAHFVIRALMFEAAKTVKLDPDRLSFAGCFHVLKSRLPECRHQNPGTFAEWYKALLDELQQERLPLRSNRTNPRVIKRKISKWPKKRDKHKPSPKLTKTFTECIVMPN